MGYCLGLVDLEHKVVCVKSSDTGVFIIMLGNYEKLNGLALPTNCFVKRKVYKYNKSKQLGTEKVNSLIGFCYFSGCTLLRRLPESPKIHGQNCGLDAFNAFQLLPRYVNTKMHN